MSRIAYGYFIGELVVLTFGVGPAEPLLTFGHIYSLPAPMKSHEETGDVGSGDTVGLIDGGVTAPEGS